MGIIYYDSLNKEFIYSLNNGQRRISAEAGFLVKSEQIGYIASGTRYKGLAFNDSLVNKVGFNVRSDNGFLTVTFDYTKLRFGCDHVSRAVMVYENPVSYTHLTLPTTLHECRSRWSPYH